MEFLFWVCFWFTSGVLSLCLIAMALWVMGIDVEKMLLNIAQWLEGNR